MPVLSVVLLLLTLLVGTFVAKLATGNFLDRKRWLVRPFQALLLGSYTPLASIAIEVLNCRHLPTGVSLVLSQPAYKCFGSVYQPYFAASVTVMVVFVAGLPLSVFGILVGLRKQLSRAWVQGTFGYLYSCYRSDRFLWEVVVLVRRVCLMLTALIVDRNLQAYTVALLSFAYMVLSAIVRPYVSDLENWVEVISLGLMAFIASTSASTLAETSADTAIAINLAALCFGLLIVFGANVYALRDTIRLVLIVVSTNCGRCWRWCCGDRYKESSSKDGSLSGVSGRQLKPSAGELQEQLLGAKDFEL